jgi:hypothetical protein
MYVQGNVTYNYAIINRRESVLSPVLLTKRILNKRQRTPKGKSKMENLDKLATWGT